MPKRYEEEINEILHKFEDWPPSDRGRQRPQPPRHDDPLTALGHLFDHISPHQLMAVGLVLIGVGVITRFLGLGMGLNLGTYTTLAGVLVLLAGYAMAVAGNRRGRLGRQQRMWRGEVVDLRPSGRGLEYWWWRLTAGLRRRRR